MINLNDMAVEIAKKEGLKEQMNIAQIKEILKITLELLSTYPVKDVLATLERYAPLPPSPCECQCGRCKE